VAKTSRVRGDLWICPANAPIGVLGRLPSPNRSAGRLRPARGYVERASAQPVIADPLLVRDRGVERGWDIFVARRSASQPVPSKA